MLKKTRYIVMTEGRGCLYRGNSRLAAWATWLLNRSHNAVAYDCGIWVVEPAYWIRVDHNRELMTSVCDNSKERKW